jgi:hypothetical protein
LNPLPFLFAAIRSSYSFEVQLRFFSANSSLKSRIKECVPINSRTVKPTAYELEEGIQTAVNCRHEQHSKREYRQGDKNMNAAHAQIIHGTVSRFVKPAQFCTIALVLMSALSTASFAEDAHSHMTMKQPDDTVKAATNTSALLRIVRESTERFRDVSVAEREGYALQFGCVSGSDSGAMGLHYVNAALVNGGVLDATRPQIVIYEPTPNGGLKLIGADYLVIADAWHAKHAGPPELMGQFFHLFEAPNRFGLPAFYTLHVWAWKDNPNGAFVNWHPNVSCESFNGQG